MNGQYPITVLGTVNGYLLSNNDILWEGPLDGTVTINNISYSVIVGFAKLESDNKIQASMTIQAVDPASEIGIPIISSNKALSDTFFPQLLSISKSNDSIPAMYEFDADGSQMNFIYINGINASKNVSVTLG